MPLTNFFKNILFSSKGFSPEFQKTLNALFIETPKLRSVLLPELLAVKSVSQIPEIKDFSQFKNYRQLLADIEGLETPKSGFFDGLVVKPDDYLRQGSLRLISVDGAKELSLLDTPDLILKGTPKLNTGSNNTLDGAITNAENFRTNLGFKELIHEYLAMDMAWWPSSTEAILPLIGKNIAVETAVIPIQAIINEAAKGNTVLGIAVDTSHSYAQAGRSMALNLFDARSIIEVKSLFLAPLGRPEAMTALVSAKNNFSGEISIVRPGFDPLEEAATSLGELYLNGIFDLLPTDVRLPIGSHTLQNISESLKEKLKTEGQSLDEFVEANYTTRPGSVSYFTTSTGEVERNIVTRSGKSYSNDAWLKQFDQLLGQKKLSSVDLLKSQSEQLEELIKIAGPTSELESMATSIKDMNEALGNATTANLYDTVTNAETTMASLSKNIQSLTTATESQMSEVQKESLDSIIKTRETYEKQLEETTEKIDDISEGKFEPEEV